MLQTDESWKTKLMLTSVAIGALAGLGTGYLMVRTAEENRGGPPEIKTTDAIRMVVNVIGLARGIASMGGPR